MPISGSIVPGIKVALIGIKPCSAEHALPAFDTRAMSDAEAK
jgi:hypothetical protein